MVGDSGKKSEDRTQGQTMVASGRYRLEPGYVLDKHARQMVWGLAVRNTTQAEWPSETLMVRDGRSIRPIKVGDNPVICPVVGQLRASTPPGKDGIALTQSSLALARWQNMNVLIDGNY